MLVRGKAYAIMRYKDVIEISLSRHNAQEILIDYILESGYNTFMYGLNFLGTSFEVAMEAAAEEMAEWRIWEFNLV